MNTKNAYPFVLALTAVLAATLACGRGETAAPITAAPTQVAATSATDLQDAAPEGTILFQDDFQDGQPDGWEITAAWDIQQAGDVYTFDASGSGGAWVPTGSQWNNYAFKTSARLDSGSLLLSLNLSKNGRYMLRLDENGVYLVKESPPKNYTILAQTGAIALGQWHQLEAMTYNGRIQVYVDTALWIDYTDSAPLSHGTIAVTAQAESQTAIDDVMVVKTGPLPEGSVQAPPPSDVELELALEIEDELTLEENPPADEAQNDQQPATGLADLVILEAFFDPDPVIAGQPFTANFRIQNQGDAVAGAFTVQWKFHEATGISVCSWDYEQLDAGAVVWGGCTKTTHANPGQSPTILTADAENEIAESLETNNESTPILIVAASGNDEQNNDEAQEESLANLLIEDIYFDPDPVIIGQPFTVHYTIENQSWVAVEHPFTVEVVFHDAVGLSVCSDTYAGMGVRVKSYITCTRTTNANPGGYITRFIVDVDNEIIEATEDDNRVTATLTLRRE